MDAKDAVARAKEYILELFATEGIKRVGLEEVSRETGQGEDEWAVTIGFERDWSDAPPTGILARAMVNQDRRYKVVRIDNQTGEVRSVRDRTLLMPPMR